MGLELELEVGEWVGGGGGGVKVGRQRKGGLRGMALVVVAGVT